MAATKIKLSDIESLKIDDGQGSLIFYKRKKRGGIEFKIRYQYQQIADGYTYCQRCGTVFEGTNDDPCPECEDHVYEIVDTDMIPDVIYSAVASGMIVSVYLWGNKKPLVFKLS